MAGSVNKVILVGNVGKDPEIRTMQSGDRVVSFGLATTERWRDKTTGERREKTEWHNIVIFNENLAKVIEQYVKKGSKLYVEGQLQHRKYQDREGAERAITEVVLQRFRGDITLLDSRGEGSAASAQHDDGEAARGGYAGSDGARSGEFGRSGPMERKPATPGGGKAVDLDDDIPF